MLELDITVVPELWNEKEEMFIPPKIITIQLEHSLVSLSKWESKWCKPFLHSDKTDEETLDYIKCMTLTENVNPDIYSHLSRQNVKEISDYINAPMTATTFSNDKSSKRNRDIITSEVIYYWMVANNIPFECQYWHLNRLITLVRVCGVHNQPPKKTSKKDLASQYATLNAQRRAKLKSKG